jgi:catechol 1,2-dioxygenase
MIENQQGDSALTEQVIASFAGTPDARLRILMQSLVQHLHAFVREVEPTEAEWMGAIRFLTETGKMCDDLVRQEFILLSDTLGVSMLVDAINHRYATGATDTTVFGPFYIKGMPERAYGENMALTPGSPVVVRGRVLDTDGEPVAGAVLDVWQTAENGMYSGQDIARQSSRTLSERLRRALRNHHNLARQLSNPNRWSGWQDARRNRQAPMATCASAFHD